MNISFKNDISSNYMVVENVSDFSQNDFGFKMISENEIKGFLKFDYEMIDGKVNLLYDITGKESLGRKYSVRKMNFSELKSLIFSINSVITNSREYLLDHNDVMLKKECIFMSSESNKVDFCYLPNYQGNFLLEIRELTAQILSFIDYDDQNAVRLAYFIQRQSQEDNFTIEGIINSFGKIIFDENVYIMKEKQIDVFKENSEYTDNLRMPLTEKSVGLNKGTESKFELFDSQRKSSESENKDGFFQKASVYFKINNASDIYDDFNHLKMLKKIKNTSADLETAKAELLKNQEEFSRDLGNQKSKSKKEHKKNKNNDTTDDTKEMFEIWN